MQNIEGNTPLPQANFINFLDGLRVQGLMQVGAIPNPMTNQRELNVPYAQYTIELLTVFAKKTAGNLSADEDEFLQAIITELTNRLQSVQTQG